MSKQELAVQTPEELAYINSLKPQGSGASFGPGIDRIDIIRKLKKDADGNKILPGQFMVGKHLAEELTFRPVRTFNQILKSVQQPDGSFKVEAQSIFFNDYSQELLDSAGGIACGRKFGKATKGMSAEEVKENKDLATVYLFVFGFVEINGEQVPAYMRLRGGKFYAFSKALDSIPGTDVMAHYNFKLKLEEVESPAGDIEYSLSVTPDLSKKLPLGSILGFDRDMNAWVSSENNKVVESHLKHNKNAQTVAAIVNDDFNDADLVDITPSAKDLSDDLPF